MGSLRRHLINVKSVESPILFFVSDSNKSMSLEQRKELLRFKDDLTEVCTRLKQKKSYFQPAVNDMVAVYCSDDERWERGRIQFVFQTLTSIMYNVFLIDEGKSVNAAVLNMCQLPDVFRHLPPQVYQIGLYGVLPKEWPSDGTEKIIEEWSLKSKHFVEELFCDAEYIYFEKIFEMFGIYFGNVIVESVDKSLMNLAKELCKNKIVKESTDFAEDIKTVYYCKANKNYWMKETNDNEDKKTTCENVLKELDISKASISAIKEFIKQSVNRKSKENDSAALSSLPKKEEHLQIKTTTSRLERDSTIQHARNISSNNSLTNYESPLQKVDKQSDILYIPLGCPVDGDLLKKEKENKHPAVVKTYGENFHNRHQFDHTNNSEDEDWTETDNRKDGTEMHNRDNRNQAEANRRRSSSSTKNSNTKGVNRTETKNREYKDHTEMVNKGGKNHAETSHKRGMNRTGMNYGKDLSWSETKNTDVIGTEMNTRYDINQTEANHRKTTNGAESKNSKFVSHTEIKDMRDMNERDWKETSNRGDINWTNTKSRRDMNMTDMNNRRDMNRTDTNSRKDANWSETKNTYGTEICNIGDISEAETNRRRNISGVKNKVTKDMNHKETKNRRDTNWTEVNHVGDLNQTETENRRDINWANTNNRRDAIRTGTNNRRGMNRTDMNNRKDTNWSETKNTDMIWTEVNNRYDMKQAEINHKRNMNEAKNKTTRDVNHTETKNRKGTKLTEINNKGDLNQVDTNNKRDVNWTDDNNKRDVNWTNTSNRRNMNRTDINNGSDMNRTHVNNRKDMNRTDTNNRRDMNKTEMNWPETNKREDMSKAPTQYSRPKLVNSETFNDKRNFNDSSNSHISLNISSDLSSADVNKNDMEYSKHLRIVEEPNKSCTNEVKKNYHQGLGSDNPGMKTQTQSADDTKSNVIDSQENVTKNKHSSDASKSVVSAMVETDAGIPVEYVDIKAMSKLSVKKMLNLLRQGKQNIGTVGVCAHQVENKVTEMNWPETNKREDMSKAPTQYSQPKPVNSETFNDKRNFNDSSNSHISLNISSDLSSADVNKNDMEYSKHLRIVEEPNKSCTNEVKKNYHQGLGSDNPGMKTQTQSADDTKSNVIDSQENVTKNKHSSDASKSVVSAMVETDAGIPVEYVDIKAMSKLSVKKMLNLLRQGKQNIGTVGVCAHQVENKVISKPDIGMHIVTENKCDELQSCGKDGNQKNDILQKTESVQATMDSSNNDINTEIRRKPVNNMKNSDNQNSLVSNEEVQQKCMNSRSSSVSNNSSNYEVKQPDDLLISDDDAVGTKHLTEKNLDLKESCLNPASSALSIHSNQSKENPGSDVNLSSEKPKNRYSDPTYFSYTTKIPVLLHGDISYEPILSVADITQDQFIFQCLQKWKLRDLSRVQRYACPVINARRDTVIVSSPCSGKSLSYIVPILSLLRMKLYYSKLRPGNGPRAVFLVSCSVSGERLYNMCKELVEPLQDLKICLTYGGGAEMEVKEELINGCDVLISTPRCLQRLLEVPYLTSLNRVCHVVLDEADILLQNFIDELRKLLMALNKVKSFLGVPLQTIIISNTWNLTLERLVCQVLQNPVICIASYMEAAIYARVKPVVSILKPDQKIHRLIELLKSQLNKNTKTVILCNTKEDVLFVKQSVEHIGIIPLAAHEGIDFMYSEGIMMSYWSSDSPVVVCSDFVLPELNITDAQCLVHFGLPETKKQFGFRFSCLLQSYRNLFKHEDKMKCEVYIYVDEGNESQFPQIMKFMERLGTSVPKILEEAVKKINMQKEKSKGNVDICENVKEFGKCWDVNKCPYRHTLNAALDQPKNVPICGRVKLQILHVHNACHYSARILEHSSVDTWTPVPSDYVNLAVDINSYFSYKNNRCLHGITAVGDIAAVETSHNTYERTQVLKISGYNYKDEPSSVICKLLDSGSIREYQVVTLLHLPENFRKQKPEAVDVYLCQLLPVDLDQNWSSAAKMAVEEWVTRIQQHQTDSFIIGRIVLNIADNLWLEPLEHVQWLCLSKTFLSQLSFRQELLKVGLAVENKTHLDTLFQLCNEANIDIPYYKERKSGKGKEDTESVIKCQWAHLPRDEYTAVHILRALSLDMIFIQMVKFNDRLELIYKDIQAAVTKKMEKLSFPSLKKDDLCLGRYPDDNGWYRAQVVDSPTEQEVKLYFVDYGDNETVTWDNVLAVPVEIITRLPFQAIECSLAGVIPIEDEEANAVDLLHNLTDTAENKLPKIVFARVCKIDLKAQKTGGRKYSVVLVDKQDEEDIVINKGFVLEGFGNWHPKEKHFLNNLPPIIIENSAHNDSDNSSEVSVIEDASNESSKETSTSTELVVKNSTPCIPQEEANKIFDYLLKGIENNTFEWIFPDVPNAESAEQFEEDTVFEEGNQTDDKYFCVQEFSEDVSTEEFNTDHSLEQSKNLYSGEATDELSDGVYHKTRQICSEGEDELPSNQSDPRKTEDTDLTTQKLNDSYSETKQANSVDNGLQMDVSVPMKIENVQLVVRELTGIVDKELHVEESDQRKTNGVKSTVENLNVLFNEKKQAQKLQMEGSETWNMKGTDSSGEESCLSYVNEAKLSCCNTDECLENELIINRNEIHETITVEKNLQVEDDLNLSNNKINQTDDKYFFEDDVNTSGEGKQSESGSLSSQTSKRRSSQLGLTEKLQTWFIDNIRTPNDSFQMQSENSDIETVAPLFEMKHKGRRRKISNDTDKTTDTDVESQDSYTARDNSSNYKKQFSDELLQNITDETDFLSSAEEVHGKKRRSLIGMIQGWLGGSRKENSDNTSLSEDKETGNNEQLMFDKERSPNMSLTEVCNSLHNDTSQNIDEHDSVTHCWSALEEQCNQKSVSPGDRLCDANQSDANTEISKLHQISLSECLNNIHAQTGVSDNSIIQNNMLVELAALQREDKDNTSKLYNFLSLGSETEHDINDETSLQNQNTIPDTSQGNHKYVDACTNQNNDFDIEAAKSQILESEFVQCCSDKESSHVDYNQTDESVLQSEENASGSTMQSSLTSSITKEHVSEIDHNIFIKMHKTKDDIDFKLLPQLVEKDSFRPQVMWHQDLFFVWLHILLHDVKKYKLLWSAREIYFKTVHNDRVYSLKLLLFGAINPELLSHSAKGFHVEIKLVKTVRGREWSRLLKTELKRPWLKLNLEAQAQFYLDDEDDAVHDSSAQNEEPEYVPSSGRDRTEYDRIMYDTDDASSSGSDVQEFEPIDNYDG